MCGYIRRVTDSPEVGNLLEEIGLGDLVPPLFRQAPGEMEHFYPAFGGNAERRIRGLIIADEGRPRLVDATWWFDCVARDDRLEVGKRTTFNARNLDSPFWREPLRHHRGIVVATGIGESKKIGGRKHQYLMEGTRPFLLGALYCPFPNGQFSCAVITRDAHLKFESYHDKAFPLFLPPTPEFVDLWLDETITQAREIDQLLEHPRLYANLEVEEVKTFKNGTVSPVATLLEADEEGDLAHP
ncbi:SOS response-associated peptidase family protein [Marinobacter salicampi]|uniref:SOS response-associated peptidase family protein n=1 Tax=Marinobacter salicampi TaxID=435907 RepID=UPI00140ADF34|nr:SOS response-associated peptidase family protein [Marinobacter salicampi]